jgi:ubiquinone/menaquinone biosynthesis C-methylase UbiE
MRSNLISLIPKKFLAAQLRQPTGWFGKIVMGDLLNKGNEKINRYAIERLEIQPTDRILDIGFGGGITIVEMLKTIETGKIYGIDFSDVMVAQARDRFKDTIAAGKVSIEFADVRKLPFDDDTFDKVCTVNTIYFWEEPEVGLREIARVLKSGGKLVVGIRSADKMKDLPFTQHNFKLYAPEAVKDLLIMAGFSDIEIEHRDKDEKFDSVIVIASALRLGEDRSYPM